MIVVYGIGPWNRPLKRERVTVQDTCESAALVKVVGDERADGGDDPAGVFAAGGDPDGP
jgi:hypothetical protein